jgi:hypothetical protein
VLTGPPYATVEDAELRHDRIVGEEPTKIDDILLDASDMVAYLAPRPATIATALSEGMTSSQATIPAKKLEAFPDRGTVEIGSELLYYFGKTNPSGGAYYGLAGILTAVRRGMHETIPATHSADDVVTLADYPLKARRAELAVFEWLWDTRGYKPSRTGVVSSESYSIGPEVQTIVRRIMGPYYARKPKTASVTSSFKRYPDFYEWIGNR